MRIFFFNQAMSEYGQSLLYHGLRKLGHDVTVNLPNTFHFKSLKECNEQCQLQTSPCRDLTNETGCSNHPAHLTLDKSRYIYIDNSFNYDLVISNNGSEVEKHRAFMNQGVPVAALDLGDSTNSAIAAWTEVLGTKPTLFFRRELIAGQYGKSLSYSFYADKSRFKKEEEQNIKVSFLSRPTSHERAVYAEALSKLPNSLIGQVKHTEYLDTISRSQFSVAVRGAGYDTLRRWEIPAMGSVLCLEESPIVVNNDFTDGVNCIKFSSPNELMDKINFYSDTNKYNELRLNCYKHFLNYHTTAQRAKQFLEDCGFAKLLP